MLEKAINLQETGEYHAALTLLEELWTSLKKPQRTQRIKCLNEQSKCHWLLGQLDDAKNKAQDALQLAKMIPKDLQGQAEALNNLGSIYWSRGELLQAENFHRQSHSLLEQLGDSKKIGKSYNSLAIYHRQRGEFDLAEECYRRSIALSEESGNTQDLAMALNNLGAILSIECAGN